MGPGRICGGCGHGGQCHRVYYRLGHAEGPSVVSKVLLAFGVPIVVFILTLTVTGTLLNGGAANHTALALLSFIVALALTALVVLGIWRITQRPADRGDTTDEVRR